MVIAVAALGASLLLRVFVVQQFEVNGESMLGTLTTGDRVVVNKLSYDLHDPRRGDMVVLKDVKGNIEVRDLIKRVIALPGETVEYRACQLIIDGHPLVEPYLDSQIVRPDHCGDSQPPVVVRRGFVFVMGDNRGASVDSRTAAIGQVPFDHLIGRATWWRGRHRTGAGSKRSPDSACEVSTPVGRARPCRHPSSGRPSR